MSDQAARLAEAGAQAALNGYPSAMVTSGSWQCPACDRAGDRHADRCFVLELADEALRLRVANKRLSETNGRLREREARVSREAEAATNLAERVMADRDKAEREAEQLREALRGVRDTREQVAQALTRSRPEDWIGYGAIVRRLDAALAAAGEYEYKDDSTKGRWNV